MLPSYDIRKLKNNRDFRTIVNTLYHEMGHVSDWCDYPNLYGIASNLDDGGEMCWTALFWIEYLAEKRSYTTGEDDKTALCSKFVEIQWHPYNYDMTYEKTNSFLYLNKVLPYFIVGTLDNDNYNRYMVQIGDALLKAYIDELRHELFELEKQLPFDAVEYLYGLNTIMKNYYDRFNGKYKLK